MGHTAESRPSDFTFANIAVRTEESLPRARIEVPDELKQTIDSAYHIMSPALSTEEANLKTYLHLFQMQDPQSTKQPLDFKIGSVLEDDWCKLGADCLRPTNSISHLSKF